MIESGLKRPLFIFTCYNQFMKLREIYKEENSPVISFEFFPPKDDADGKKTAALLTEISLLKKYNPALVSLTHGAGGTDRTHSVEIINSISSNFGINVMPHFTCICSTRADVDNRLELFKSLAVENILALRGDIPKDTEKCFHDFYYANELVEYINAKSDFSVAVAGYPYGHCESKNLKSDIDNLKRKVDAGADVIYTQLFFDNKVFYDFLERVRNAGITVPVAAGIMPVVSIKQTEKIISDIKVKIPADLLQKFEKFSKNPEDIKKIGVEFASLQCSDLIKQKVDGIHFYTLNKSDSVSKILDNNFQ